jgi:hypothetical protein
MFIQFPTDMPLGALLVLRVTCIFAIFDTDFTVKNPEDTPGLYYDHMGR